MSGATASRSISVDQMPMTSRTRSAYGTRLPVEPSPDQKWLLCRRCRLRYEVKDDIPIMLVEEAQPLEE